MAAVQKNQKNGTRRIISIIAISLTVGLLVFGWGVSYGRVKDQAVFAGEKAIQAEISARAAELKATQAESRAIRAENVAVQSDNYSHTVYELSHENEKAIIEMRGDIKYIRNVVDKIEEKLR